MQRISLYVEDDLKEWLEEIAKSDNRSANQCAVLILEEERKKKSKKIAKVSDKR